MKQPRVLILMGSDSDLPVMETALKFLREMEVPYSVDISSAHRHPEKTVRYAREARQEGFEVIIAMAGMAAHLAGVIASHTTLPVIGVPASSGALQGMDALLSTVQMPPGIPVATVGIDASRNAAILACEILSIKDDLLRLRLERMKDDLRLQNEEKSRKLRESTTD